MAAPLPVPRDPLLDDDQAAFLDVVDQWAGATLEPAALALDRGEARPGALAVPLAELGVMGLARTDDTGGGAPAPLALRAVEALAVRSAATALTVVASHAAPPGRADAVVVEGIGPHPVVATVGPDGTARLSGEIDWAVGADEASALVVIARDPADAVGLWVVAPRAVGLTVTTGPPRPGLVGARAAVGLDAVAATALHTSAMHAGDLATAARSWWAAGVAAAAVGVARRAVDDAAAYLADREQFGVSLAQLPELDRLVRHHRSRIGTSRAALGGVALGWGRSAVDPLRPGATALADLVDQVVDDALAAVIDALQLHGGYGYIDEYAVERCYRDAQSLRALGRGWASTLRTTRKEP